MYKNTKTMLMDKKKAVETRAGGEQAVFRQYFDEYYQTIRRFIYYKTGDADMADDVVQQVFLRLWEVRDTVDQSTVKSLLYAMATNVLRNHFKHQKVVYGFVAKNPAQESNDEWADFDIQQEEFNQTLQRVLDKMPEKSRAIFLMSRMEGLTYGEIASRLELSVKAIEKRMHQALEIVRECISYKI